MELMPRQTVSPLFSGRGLGQVPRSSEDCGLAPLESPKTTATKKIQ
jgi:hypothetical protein